MARYRFSSEADVSLLTEAIAVNPYTFANRNGQGWAMIANNLSRLEIFPDNLSSRTVRERLALLIDKYKRELQLLQGQETESSICKNEEDILTEKHTLLESICQLREDTLKVQYALACRTSASNAAMNSVPTSIIRNVGIQMPVPQAVEAPIIPTPTSSESSTPSFLTDRDDSEIALAPGFQSEKVSARRKRPAENDTIDSLWQYMKMKEERRLKELELQQQREQIERIERQKDKQWQHEKDQLDHEERRRELERQREREQLDREERKSEMERQREREQLDREERRREMDRQWEMQELDREERRKEMDRQREKEELDREKRRKEMERQWEREERDLQRQKDKDEKDREERKLLMQILMKVLKQ